MACCPGGSRQAARSPRAPGGLPTARNLLLAVLAACCALGAAAARPDAAAALGGGRALHQAPPPAPACTCPDAAAASAACASAPQDERDSILRTSVRSCSRLGFAAPICCPAMPTTDAPTWQTWAACLCSGGIPGLSAFVDGARVVTTCGCDGAGTAAPSGGQLPTSFTPGGVLGAILGPIPGGTPPPGKAAAPPPGTPPIGQVVEQLQQAGVVGSEAGPQAGATAPQGTSTPPADTPPPDATPGQSGSAPGHSGDGRR